MCDSLYLLLSQKIYERRYAIDEIHYPEYYLSSCFTLSQRLWQNIWIFLGFCTHILVKCVLHLKFQHGTPAQQSGSSRLTPNHMKSIGQPIAISPEDFRASCMAFKSRFEKKKKKKALKFKARK